MLRSVACDSFTARTMPRRSPLTSVTPALSMATSVPVPIAMPTSACARAGASLIPSPAIATTWPCDGIRSALRIGREHHDRDAAALQGGNGLRCVFLDRIGYGRERCGLAVDC